MSCQGHDGVTFGTKMYPWGSLFGDYFGLTSGLLQAYFSSGLLGFLGFVWGKQMMQM